MDRASRTQAFKENLLTERLGPGKFGIVYKAFYGDRWAAVRKFSRFQDVATWNQSVQTLIDVNHDNIIKIYDFILQKTDAYLIMEYAENGSLHNYLHNKRTPAHYSWQVALNWGLQIAEGIAFLHGLMPKGIIHGHIRPGKILISRGGRTLKIDNLDSAFHNNRMLIGYTAPEAIENGVYTEKMDVYSWATTFSELLTLQKPIYNVAPPLDCMLEGTPEAVKVLISKCRVRSINERFTMRQAAISLKRIISSSSSKLGTLSTLEEVPFTELQLGKKLGYGSTGNVRKAFFRDKIIALKQIYYTVDPMSVKKQLISLSSVHHINVTSLFGVTLHDGTLNLLLEYAENGSLHEFLHGPMQYNYSNKLALDWGIQIANGMAYLHDMRPISIIHANVNSRNILISRGGQLLKLSLPMKSKKLHSVHIAPEVFKENVSTEKSDVYSWGFIMWEVLSRKEPLRDQKLLFDNQIDCPQELKVLIQKCSEQKAAQRPTIKTIISQMILNTKTLIPNNDEEFQMPQVGSDIVHKHFWQDKLIAVKRCHRYNNKTKTMDEINNLSQLNHVNVIAIYGYSTIENVIYIHMEYAENGSLHNFLHGAWQPEYSLSLAIHWGLQLAEGINYLYSMDIRHGDIRPNNVFLFSNCRLLKIGNFESFYALETTRDRINWYRAPDVYPTYKSDVYSWAITMNEILTREEPDDEPFIGFANIFISEEGPVMGDNGGLMADCPQGLLDLLEQCWQKDKFKRPSMDYIVDEYKNLYSFPHALLTHWDSAESLKSLDHGCFKCVVM
ncbi:tyrosine-protein kinase JAK1-like [Drosophila willistoni]|uniref:tyrosine-protein kinase JAK1-like n=1 Tax=Drosophila willistoni TaxID=7260 RepID=UPI000C26C50E|nr:tyrosine-protein kinase JAK1-like [Drosophila willistoni]